MCAVTTVLLIATSPRSTWITATDPDTAAAVRTVLGDRCSDVHRGGQRDGLACDVGIGVEAFEAGELLQVAGFTFQWHDDQHPANRTDSAWGIPVEGNPPRDPQSEPSETTATELT